MLCIFHAIEDHQLMSTMKSPSGSPQSLKRERDDEDDFESPLHIPDGEGFRTEDQGESNIFQTQDHVTDCGASNSFSTPLRTRTPNSTFKTESNHPSLPSIRRESSPARSSTGSLSDAGTSTPVGLRPSPSTAFTALNGIVEPPKKRAKLTFAEREEQRILKAVRDQEKAEERAQREMEKKAKEVDRARKDAEKEAEKRKREAEREEKRLAKEVERAEKEEKRLVKEAERVEKDKEKKVKEDERKRREEEKQKIEEEKRKKERSQSKLNAFFKKPVPKSEDNISSKSPSPVPGATSKSSSTSLEKSSSNIDGMSDYQKRFPPFFVQKHVKVAPFTKYSRDGRASSALQDAIDSYINGQRSHKKQQSFDPVILFNLPSFDLKPRGRCTTPVRDIMSQILGNAKQPIDLTTDSQNMKIKNTRNQLRKIPYKILSFAEDVRPPYKGTYTSQPKSGIRKLARNPIRRDLPNVNYDYDSEAEWEDDDGEDVESDCNDEEDLGDNGDDLEEFLDDAEAETLNARKLVMQGDLEPKCSGLCWENQNRRGPNVKMYRYVMEFITEGDQITIDPLATHYWDAPNPAGPMDPPRVPLNTIKFINTGMNGANDKGPATSFKSSDMQKPATSSSKTSSQLQKLVPIADMPAFKKAVQGNELSKLGLIEVLNKQFPKISKASIKTTLETIAKRVGAKEADKRWVLIDGTESQGKVNSSLEHVQVI